MRATLFFFLLAPLALAADPNEGAIGIQFKLEEGEVIIIDTVKGSPADKAGLKKDDVLLKVNAIAAESTDAVSAEISRHKPGAKIKVTYKRGSKETTVEVTVGKRSEVLRPKE